MNNIISIIVPIYNVEKYLAKCLDSIKNQTFQDLEVLMIDDGSTDNSGEIAKTYLTDNRFKYIHTENNGQGAARNKGLDIATGNYVCFIDSDDFISPEYIMALLNLLATNDADIAQCGVNRVWEDGKIKPYAFTGLEKKVFTDIKKYIATSSFVMVNKLYKISLFDGLRFPGKVKFEDFVLAPQVYERATSIVSTDLRLYNYLWRSNSTTTQIKIQTDILKAFHILESSSFGQHNPDLMHIFFVRQVVGSLIWAMAQQFDEYKDEIKNIMSNAVKQYPQLREYIMQEYIGKHKVFFGKQLVAGNYKMAHYYVMGYTKVYNLLRKRYIIQ